VNNIIILHSYITNMPVKEGHDKHGRFYQWGHQKKYYFHNEETRKHAKQQAILQGYAIQKSEQRHGGLYSQIS